MEKGEGIALRKKFDVNAFPTMFILMLKEILWVNCREHGIRIFFERIERNFGR